jgi:hypothetical protein
VYASIGLTFLIFSLFMFLSSEERTVRDVMWSVRNSFHEFHDADTQKTVRA